MTKTNKTKKEAKKVRALQAKVIRLSNEKTLNVSVEIKYAHPVYGKIIKSHKKYNVHFEGDAKDINPGDSIIIEEIKPISKTKNWKFIKKIK